MILVIGPIALITLSQRSTPYPIRDTWHHFWTRWVSEHNPHLVFPQGQD